MKPDTYLILGDLSFSRFEVPETINFGGEQALAVQKLVGGKRIIDSMGRDDEPLRWSGQFQGEDATARAQYLNYLRIAGQSLNLTWGEFSYAVVIRSAHMDFQRLYQIPYSIVCEVVEDLTQPVSSVPESSIDTAIAEDLAKADALAGSIGDGTLSGLMSTLKGAVSTVSSFASATQSTINSVLQPLAAVQKQVTTLIGSTGNVISNIATVGGILPNNPIAQNAAKLTGQIAGYTQLPLLLNLQSTAGRMGLNLGAAASGKSVVTAGGDLFTMASKAYGDVAAWTTLARANKLADPQLVGVQKIVVPRVADSTGGVYAN
jgi:hypothetical protein